MTGKFVDNYLLFQLAAISHSLSAQFYDYLRTQSINPSRWRILVNLVDGGGMYVSELVKNTMFEQSRVTKIIDQLAEDGLVERIPDAKDRRRVKVRITPKGETLTVPMIEAAKEHEAQVLAELPPEDREYFRKALAHFVHSHFKAEKSTSD